MNSVLASDMALSTGGTPLGWWIAPASSLVALAFAGLFFRQMMRAPKGNETMEAIASYVRQGASAYLFRQYKVVTVVFLILALIFAVMAVYNIQNLLMPAGFLLGGFLSGLCGFIGMKTATHASSRTAQGATIGLDRALKVAFRSGAVMGLVVVGFGLLEIVLWYFILDRLVYTPHHMQNGLTLFGIALVSPGTTPATRLAEITTAIIAFGMGASMQALFARVGGGIFTKAADVGADLVGKVEAGIPEDDPRNPAVIADNVGDNVGDVAGMGADLYQSYCGSIIATSALGAALPLDVLAKHDVDPVKAVLAPMVVAGLGILLSILGIYLVRAREDASQKNLLRALLLGTATSSALMLIALAVMVLAKWMTWGLFGSVTSGLFAGVLIGQCTEYFTSDTYKPTRGIAAQAPLGAATTIIDGIATGMLSSGLPVGVISIAILAAFGFAGGFTDVSIGLYGVGFAAVGMLATLGITLATDAYGPIADNAEMSHLDPEVRRRTDALDALGNTTAATGKGFAIGSAALTALSLLAANVTEVRIWIGRLADESANGIYSIGTTVFYHDHLTPQVQAAFEALRAHAQAAHQTLPVLLEATSASLTDLAEAYALDVLNPRLMAGLFIGCMIVFVFTAMTMKAVGRAAGRMIAEVRHQFRERPGIMEGTEAPDYARCVDISTAGAQREMVAPALLAIIVPTATGVCLGVSGLMGLLAGSLACGFVMAVTLNNAGGAWDNAKKYIERGAHGGKGSDAHKAAVVGDTVGDPFKDTAGPSLNILIKLMAMVSIVFTGLITKFSPIVMGALGLGWK